MLAVKISDELRGWETPPVQSPTRGFLLSVSELSNRYFPTYRDLYLRRIVQAPPKVGARMLDGLFIHGVVQETVTVINRLLYTGGVTSGSRLIRELLDQAPEVCTEVMGRILERLPGSSEVELHTSMKRAMEFYEFLVVQAAARLDQVLSRFPHSELDSIISHAMPPIVERKVDGSLVGLSKAPSVDMYEPRCVLKDPEAGESESFHHELDSFQLPVNLK
jgi:CRISPR-associated protein Csa1